MSRYSGLCPVCCLSNGVNANHVPSAVQADNASFARIDNDYAHTITCPRCGEYVVTNSDIVNLESPRLRAGWDPVKLSALLRERSDCTQLPKYWLRAGMSGYGPLGRSDLMPVDIDELSSSWPTTVAARLDRTLCNLANLSKIPGNELHLQCHHPSFQSIAFAAGDLEAKYYFKSLVSLGYLTSLGSTNTGISVVVAPAGWARVTELDRKSAARTNKVFVAMWFGVLSTTGSSSAWSQDRMHQVFEEGIASGVRRAGYDVTRVDLEHYNEGVMDRVLGDIRAAPFVVADFTGHRNGVYLEAGFASGLGKQVIHTCHESEFGKAHFDIAHINRIKWSDVADLQELLFQRIRGSIGEGPFVSASRALNYRRDAPDSRER